MEQQQTDSSITASTTETATATTASGIKETASTLGTTSTNTVNPLSHTNTTKQNATRFEEMALSQETLRAVAEMGFEEATPIQAQCISLIMSGRDVIGQSQTGTGKTAAFGIPLLEKLDPFNKKLQAVVLCPTRELAIQISEEFRKLLRYRDNIRVAPIYGGQPIDRQITLLRKGVQVIAGTPGRVMDHIERRTLRLEDVHVVVLDEADEMLDMGFKEDIEFILSRISAAQKAVEQQNAALSSSKRQTSTTTSTDWPTSEQPPSRRQTLLFSATMPKAILNLTEQYQHDPVHIKVSHKSLTVPSITQAYFEVREALRLEALCRIIDAESPGLSLVFCNTKKRVDELVEQLQGRGYFAEGLHGDLKQAQRDLVMKKFRNRTLEILVATDVAARGLDVDDIDVVFNYDLPQDEEYYVHRIGRTGRAGKDGRAYTFAAGREVYRLKDIMRFTGAKIERRKMPTLTDIEEIKTRSFVEKIIGIIEQGHLAKYTEIVESLAAEDYAVTDIAAALFKHHLHDEEAEDIVFEEPPTPFTSRKNRETRDARESRETDGTMERLFITVGKKDKVKPNDIVGAIAGETGVSGRVIGQIDIYDEFTFVDVPRKVAKEIITGMKNKKIRGKKIHVERARKK